MNEPTNLLIPFRRDRKNDFAFGSGDDLLRSKVMQVLLTQGATARSSGELPWRTAFGSGLELLRHQRNDHVLAELARVNIRDALRRWVSEAQLTNVQVTQSGVTLDLRVCVEGVGSASIAGSGEVVRLTILREPDFVQRGDFDLPY